MDRDLQRLFMDVAHVRDVAPVLTAGDLRCAHTLAESELRIRWRLRWYRQLIDGGWAAPEAVRAQMARDEALLETDVPDDIAELVPQPDAACAGPANGSSGPEVPAADGHAERVATLSANDDTAGHLRAALASRAVIEQAKGMLMADARCDETTAFRMLVAASQRSRRKLRDVAAEIVARMSTSGGGPR